jgi:two-component system phosphate regulon response regulator PhoB
MVSLEKPAIAIPPARHYSTYMIFLVEDNDAIRETVVAYLRLGGREVKEFPRVKGVVEALEFQLPDLLILDIMLPDGNGFELAQKIHERYPSIPFLFLTAREAESDRITGLEIGADDYVVKPFSPRELSLRVEAILRRTSPKPADGSGGSPILQTWKSSEHGITIDEANHSVERDGVPVRLTLAEWNILLILVRRGRSVTTREHILGEALDYLHDGSDRTVNTHISNIRAKLGDGNWIETIRGVGYRFLGEA